MKSLGVAVLGLLIAGCHTATLPDPNEPTSESATAETLQKELQSISDDLLSRAVKRQISMEQYRALYSEAAARLVKKVQLNGIAPDEAWQYADMLRSARDWKTADELYVKAIKYAKATKNEDRRINDTLRLAQVKAKEGEPKSAILLARETLDAKEVDSAPILPAIYFEVAPNVRDRGYDRELADLLVDAAEKHLLTQVDVSRPEGQDFMLARPIHVGHAYTLAAELYGRLGDHAKEQDCLRKAAMTRSDIDGLTEIVRKKRASAPPPGAQQATQSHS